MTAALWLLDAAPVLAVIETPPEKGRGYEDPSHGASCVGESCTQGLSSGDLVVVIVIVLVVAAIFVLVRRMRRAHPS